MKRVILLAGHNFQRPGCVNTIINPDKPITEFDLTSYVVSEVFKRERLMEVDTVIKARNDYSDLVKEVNSLNGDILISMHFNAYNKKAQGSEVLYAEGSEKGRAIANEMQYIMMEELGLMNRGVKGIGKGERGATILNKTKPVAILIEPFFLDEIQSQERLDELLDKTVNSILRLLKSFE